MNRSGFTLLELLIALAILAIVSIAVFTQGGDTVRQIATMEQTTLARWVAENEMAKLRLERRGEAEPPRRGSRRIQVSHGERYWMVEREIGATSDPWMYRVELKVHALVDGREVGPVDTLIGYLGQH